MNTSINTIVMFHALNAKFRSILANFQVLNKIKGVFASAGEASENFGVIFLDNSI